MANNGNILVDSSAWIDFFKGKKEVSFVAELLLAKRVCTNDIVLTELLPSMQAKKEDNLIKLMNQISKFNIEIRANAS